MSNRQDCRDLYLHMKKAEDLCLSISSIYSKNMLLHGDIHPENILLGSDGEYIIIDPKGVVGDPVFDIAHYIVNEFDEVITEELYQKINYIINDLEMRLHIPNEILRECLYIQTAMTVCWDVEDGSPPTLDRVAFAEALLRN
ncbi:aminoglycoside phosphotransferase family protein [Paenibacillus marinisediminis]